MHMRARLTGRDKGIDTGKSTVEVTFHSPKGVCVHHKGQDRSRKCGIDGGKMHPGRCRTALKYWKRLSNGNDEGCQQLIARLTRIEFVYVLWFGVR
jgi:hypothetical protein